MKPIRLAATLLISFLSLIHLSFGSATMEQSDDPLLNKVRERLHQIRMKNRPSQKVHDDIYRIKGSYKGDCKDSSKTQKTECPSSKAKKAKCSSCKTKKAKGSSCKTKKAKCSPCKTKKAKDGDCKKEKSDCSTKAKKGSKGCAHCSAGYTKGCVCGGKAPSPCKCSPCKAPKKVPTGKLKY